MSGSKIKNATDLNKPKQQRKKAGADQKPTSKTSNKDSNLSNSGSANQSQLKISTMGTKAALTGFQPNTSVERNPNVINIDTTESVEFSSPDKTK